MSINHVIHFLRIFGSTLPLGNTSKYLELLPLPHQNITVFLVTEKCEIFNFFSKILAFKKIGKI